jgi:multiple sugar transport system ATP-binding protein
MADIGLEAVTKRFSDGTEAVSALDLHIADGEFLVLVGPSGCGKTTALRMIAGLEEVTSGLIRIGERVVNDLAPKQRDIAMVFQDYALYPHMTVFDNMAFALKLQKLPRAEIRARVEQAADTLHLRELLKRRPRALSGGQRQRVAMGRAIVRQPQAFLLDEPLSNLDAKLRVQMRAEIARIQRSLEVTTVYVTHDQTEAMTMGDRVAVMNGGVLQQVAPPEELYRRPANVFTAGFIGAPAMNLVEAEILDVRSEAFSVRFGAHELRCPRVGDDVSFVSEYVGRKVVLGIRPEQFEDPQLVREAPDDRCIEVEVDVREALGSETLLVFASDARTIATDQSEVTTDGGTWVNDEGEASTLVARVNAESKLREGDRARLVVDTSSLYFFDPESGKALREAR